MHKKFKQKFARLQNLLQQYEDELKNISHEQANQVRSSDTWTIAEIVYHISWVEKGIILSIQKKMQDLAGNKKAGLKSFYRATLLHYALRSKRKFRAPKVLEKPQGPYDVASLMAEWKVTRKALEELFNSIPQEQVNRQLFKHPIVGGISLKQTLGFMADHKQRHLDQITNIKKGL
jgi:hypothetical protein